MKYTLHLAKLESIPTPPHNPVYGKNLFPRAQLAGASKVGTAVQYYSELRKTAILVKTVLYKGCRSGVANEEKRVTKVKSGNAPDVKLPWLWNTSNLRHTDMMTNQENSLWECPHNGLGLDVSQINLGLVIVFLGRRPRI